MKCIQLAGLVTMAWGGVLLAGPTTEPTTRPATQPTTQATTQATTEPALPVAQGVDAERTLDTLLRARPGMARPIQPIANGTDIVVASRSNAVAPIVPSLPLKREGSIISQRIGRLQQVRKDWEFHFESDGAALQDPPMIVLASRKRMEMEDQVRTANRDIRFLINGVITEYRGRNYLLIEKAGVIGDDTRP